LVEVARKEGEHAFGEEPEAPKTPKKRIKEAVSHRRGGGDDRLYELLDALEAVRKGDLAVKLSPGAGVYGELATSFNNMVQMIGGLAGEVSRVAREVGEEGKLDANAKVIMVTAVGQDAMIKKCEKIGIQGYVTKPFKETAITKKVQEVLAL
tara:strand:+ start:271 stop:726 length:456 start_codon:yes stop_codon:yes gene_type:complete